ncbi:MAG: hypothetical protein ACODUE_05185 [Synechococcus sp.]
MTKRMLDTNAVRAEQRCCISVIVAAQIRYGLEKKELNALSEGCALVSADQAFANVAEGDGGCNLSGNDSPRWSCISGSGGSAASTRLKRT